MFTVVDKLITVALLCAATVSVGIGAMPFTTAALAHTAVPTAALMCDETLKKQFRPDSQTKVVLVRFFRKDEPLILSGAPNPDTLRAANDICLVKLIVGPGNAGPAGAPSTSPGIGIEVWLPTPKNWNGRIHLKGGGGWDGNAASSPTKIAVPFAAHVIPFPMEVAGIEGAVSATTDGGFFWDKQDAGINGSFGMLPDGRLNRVLLHDFSRRAVHETALKAKALTRAFFGRDAEHSYFDGFSEGGRQAVMAAQAYPGDFDGILSGAPALNWTRFGSADMYPQIVTERDLGGRYIERERLDAVSRAAIASCDKVGNVHLGVLLFPERCTYDPTKDAGVLCASDGGGGPANTCVTRRQATAINKFWYGMTADGSVPDPTVDNGMNVRLSTKQSWYGLTRGSSLALVNPVPFPVLDHLLALELGDAKIAGPSFINATAKGVSAWRSLDFVQLQKALDDGSAPGSPLSEINTDSSDLRPFRAHGGRILLYHGLADIVIPVQGSIHYYHRVMNRMGGTAEVQKFFRLYLVPGMSHSFVNGTADPQALVPYPDHAELYRRLTDWVEKGIPPERYDISAHRDGEQRGWPLCVYPAQPQLIGRDPTVAADYACH